MVRGGYYGKGLFHSALVNSVLGDYFRLSGSSRKLLFFKGFIQLVPSNKFYDVEKQVLIKCYIDNEYEFRQLGIPVGKDFHIKETAFIPKYLLEKAGVDSRKKNVLYGKIGGHWIYDNSGGNPQKIYFHISDFEEETYKIALIPQPNFEFDELSKNFFNKADGKYFRAAKSLFSSWMGSKQNSKTRENESPGIGHNIVYNFPNPEKVENFIMQKDLIHLENVTKQVALDSGETDMFGQNRFFKLNKKNIYRQINDEINWNTNMKIQALNKIKDDIPSSGYSDISTLGYWEIMPAKIDDSTAMDAKQLLLHSRLMISFDFESDTKRFEKMIVPQINELFKDIVGDDLNILALMGYRFYPMLDSILRLDLGYKYHLQNYFQEELTIKPSKQDIKKAINTIRDSVDDYTIRANEEYLQKGENILEKIFGKEEIQGIPKDVASILIHIHKQGKYGLNKKDVDDFLTLTNQTKRKNLEKYITQLKEQNLIRINEDGRIYIN